jgi:ABC-type enterochelin transport system permease subunit
VKYVHDIIVSVLVLAAALLLTPVGWLGMLFAALAWRMFKNA